MENSYQGSVIEANSSKTSDSHQFSLDCRMKGQEQDMAAGPLKRPPGFLGSPQIFLCFRASTLCLNLDNFSPFFLLLEPPFGILSTEALPRSHLPSLKS